MAAVSRGARPLRQGIPVHSLHGLAPARSIHIPAFTPRPNPPAPSTAQRIFSETRTLFTRLVSQLVSPVLSHSSSALSTQPAALRPIQLSNSQNISSRFSLPVKHALSRPFSAPRLPRPPAVPANVTQIGLGTARAFHSGRPIFQNMVDNVPIATRALWEAEWDVKMKKKEARRMRRAAENNTVPKSQEMLKPKPKLVIPEPQCDGSELDLYFPIQPTPDVTAHLLVPLAPTPTARLPLSARTDGGDAHRLLPIADLASTHTSHRLHSLRVSTLFARLDTADVWDDPGVNVDAYAFGPRPDVHDVRERQCTILRVTFRGWDANRVRSILGDSAEEWYSLQETHSDGHPTLVPPPVPRQDMHVHTRSGLPSLVSIEVDSSGVSEVETDDGGAVLSPPPARACASTRHDLVFPTLDFSSTFSDAVDNFSPPVMPLRTASELAHDAELALQSSCALTDSEGSWEHLGLNSSFLRRAGDRQSDDVAQDVYSF